MMRILGAAALAAILLCAGCAYTIAPDEVAPASIIGGYNLRWGEVCAGEAVAEGEKVATFTFTLDEAGRAQNITLVQKTNDCLAEAARAELEKWTFAALEYRGQPIRNAVYRLNFIYSEGSQIIVVNVNEATGEIESLDVRREE